MLVTIRGQRIERTIMEVSPLNLGGGEAFYSLFSRQFSCLHTSYWKYHTSLQKINTALLNKRTRTHLPLKGQRDFFNSFRASCRLCNNCIRFTCMVKVT